MAQDYLYGSARLRALENRMIGRERMAVLAKEANAAAVWKRLREYGVEPICDSAGRPLREETLLALQAEAFREVGELFPDDALLRLWLYPYDCNNLKAAIKAAARGIDPSSMMFPFGTVPAADTVGMVRDGAFAGFSPKLAAAAGEAMERFAKTHDPQTVDLCMDRACYADMLSAAAGHEFIRSLVVIKIDLTNLLTLLRLLRMNNGDVGALLLERAWLEGGSWDATVALDCYRQGEAAVWGFLHTTPYDRLASRLGQGARLSEIECAQDNYFMEILQTVKFASFGAEVAAAYLLATEYEVRNLRIILAAKESGTDGETLQERIRDCYV